MNVTNQVSYWLCDGSGRRDRKQNCAGLETVANGFPASPSANKVREVARVVGSSTRHTGWDESQASFKSPESLPAFSTHMAKGGPPGGFMVTAP